MAGKRSPLLIIFLTIFIDIVGFGIVIPVLPLYTEGTMFNATPLQLGLLVGIYSLIQFFCSPIVGKISDRVGRKPVLLVSVLGTAIGFLIMGAAGSLWMLFLGRIIDGASGGNISTAQACIADVTTPENRSKSMGLIGAAFGLGFVFGPAIGGVLGNIWLPLPFYFAAGLAFLNLIFIALILPETHGPEHRLQTHERAPISDVFTQKNGTLIIAIIGAYFLCTVGFSMMTTLFALFNEKHFAYNSQQTGFILAYVGLLGAFIQGGLLRRLLKKPVEKQLAVVGSLVFAAGMFLLPLSHNLATLLVATGIIAVGNSLVTPTLMGLVSRSADRRIQGRTLGVLQSGASLARFVGPLLATWLLKFDLGDSLTRYGRTPFWASAAIFVVTTVLIATLSPVKISGASPAAVPEV